MLFANWSGITAPKIEETAVAKAEELVGERVAGAMTEIVGHQSQIRELREHLDAVQGNLRSVEAQPLPPISAEAGWSPPPLTSPSPATSSIPISLATSLEG